MDPPPPLSPHPAAPDAPSESVRKRIVAVQCGMLAGGDPTNKPAMVAAGRVLRRQLGAVAPRHSAGFVRQWLGRFQKNGSVHDAPHTGRPRKVPDDVALTCAKAMAEGIGGEHFFTVKDAHDRNPIFGLVEHMYDVTPASLMARMKQSLPRLMVRKADKKRGFKPHEKEARIKAAQELMALFPEEAAPGQRSIHDVVFVDETQMRVSLDGRGNPRVVWALRGEDLDVVASPPDGQKHEVLLKWVVGVNSRVGVVGPFFTSGTTGEPLKYKVGC